MNYVVFLLFYHIFYSTKYILNLKIFNRNPNLTAFFAIYMI
ncbi:hypothetical protein DAT561_p0017 (plasmid) [Melissococcus plutonius]|uniref:Uncharacterized protein n=1 Tax=Melissococcus plutonius TaxID=33970 RepID=A0A2Z5Y4X5_9ENTE|nr:hypothetical protein DAT561_p0017 [Melissococcus plutonius]